MLYYSRISLKMSKYFSSIMLDFLHNIIKVVVSQLASNLAWSASAFSKPYEIYWGANAHKSYYVKLKKYGNVINIILAISQKKRGNIKVLQVTYSNNLREALWRQFCLTYITREKVYIYFLYRYITGLSRSILGDYKYKHIWW